MAFYESILASHHRTLNGEEADFFFVPVLDSCIITRADDAPHLSMKVLLMPFCIMLVTDWLIYVPYLIYIRINLATVLKPINVMVPKPALLGAHF